MVVVSLMEPICRRTKKQIAAPRLNKPEVFSYSAAFLAASGALRPGSKSLFLAILIPFKMIYAEQFRQ